MGIPSTVATYPEKGWKASFDTMPLKEIKLWNYVSWTYYYCSRIMLAVYFGDLEAGCGYIEPLHQLTKANNAFIVVSVRLFCSGLIISRLAQRTKKKRKRNQLRRKAQQFCDGLKATIELRGGNNLHRYLLMQADLMAASGKESEDSVKAAYDKAISTAARSGYIHETALANELAAEYFLAKSPSPITRGGSMRLSASTTGNPLLGTSSMFSTNGGGSSTYEFGSTLEDETDLFWPREHLRNAISLYNEWGAKAKVEQLLEKYPNLVDRSSVDGADTSSVSTSHGDRKMRHSRRRLTKHTADTRMCVAAAHKIMAEVNLDAL